jgi:ATP-dependent Clp protease ATP-binding subunit ClpA
MIVVNMSEYKEAHKVSRLTGSAKGYVGYGEGGVLTNAVKNRPYSVVLLDEIERPTSRCKRSSTRSSTRERCKTIPARK